MPELDEVTPDMSPADVRQLIVQRGGNIPSAESQVRSSACPLRGDLSHAQSSVLPCSSRCPGSGVLSDALLTRFDRAHQRMRW
jgi:hypothetical protein